MLVETALAGRPGSIGSTLWSSRLNRRSSPSNSVIEGLRRALQTISHEVEDSKDLRLARARLVESTPSLQTLVLQHEQEWVESFANAVADRLGLDPDDDLRPELTAAVVAAFRAVMNRWIRSGNADVDQMLDQGLVFLGSGLGSSDFD